MKGDFIMKYNIDTMREAAQNYITAECDFREQSARIRKARENFTYWKNREEMDATYWRLSRESDAAWYALNMMCQLVNADPMKVLAVEKAIRRNSQYMHGWEREAKLRFDWWADMHPEYGMREAGSDSSYRHLVRKTSGEENYYTSTGRRKGWAA